MDSALSSSRDHTEPTLIYRAGWICPVDQPPISNGAIAVQREKIISVGRTADVKNDCPTESRVVDLGFGAIVPGLVNAHTHLEFSDLKQPLGGAGIEFTDWIRLIVARRNAASRPAQGADSPKSSAIALGLAQSLESGVNAIGEIATMPFEKSDYVADHPISCLVFLEQLGRGVEDCSQRESELTSFLNHVDPISAHKKLTGRDRGFVSLAYGASPHAPYSVGTDLLQQIITQSQLHRIPVAMHLAETLAEREFVENTTGPFVELLKDFGIWNPAAFRNQLSNLEILSLLAETKALVVHGNYLTDSELDFVAAKNDRLSIAFCPRTHAFFGHAIYPLEKMLARGINVCVGTDSLASNPDLRLLEDLKLIKSTFPQLDANMVLQMATINGARALGITKSHGTIATGKTAAISYVVHPDSTNANSPYEWMFETETKCQPLPKFGENCV